MKKVLALVAVFSLALVSTASAEEGKVANSLLADLGLGSMTTMSDEAGTEIRGMSANAAAYSASLIFGQLVDNANPGQFFVASDFNGSNATDENAGLQADALSATGPNGSSVIGNLSTTISGVNTFLGSFAGNGGHAANNGAAGLSAARGN